MAAAGNGTVTSAERAVAYWLCGCAGMVGGMVLIGGLTRLTISGLSMVDWKPQGSLPPIGRTQWEVEFERYKSYPQWQRSDKNMTLSDFKTIFYWEWGHRMLGRATGLVFAVPLAYFGMRGRIPSWLWPRLGGMFLLGGTQGLIGWWMVKSGLSERTLDPHKVARVSPYRLATHLTLAFTLYSTLVWTAMDLLRPQISLSSAAAAGFKGPLGRVRLLQLLSRGAGALVFTTVVAGAFVAGNDAGRAYNTFPDMCGEFIPSEAFEMQPLWRNAFENSALVQFNHRYLGMTTASVVGGMLLTARPVWTLLSTATQISLGAVGGLVVCQVGLGITALLWFVPVELGSAHQVGALSLWTATLVLMHTLRPSRPAALRRFLASSYQMRMA